METMENHNTKAVLGEDDEIKACPFCGAVEVQLLSTWTASYWMECECCRASIHGLTADDLGFPEPNHKNPDAHLVAANDALARWNDRV